MAIIKVKTGGITADAVTDALIADDVVGTEHLTANEVDTAALKADAVTGAELADNAVNSEHYTDGSIDTAHIADNQVTLAKMAGGTDGNIISFDASGDPVAIATGNDGQVLTSTGAGSPPAFEAIPAGGKVLQVVQAVKTDVFSASANSFTDITGVSAAITPSATSSKILIFVDLKVGGEGSQTARLLRGSTVIYAGASASNRPLGFANFVDISTYACEVGSATFLDSPATTSATTYKIQMISSAAAYYINRTRSDRDTAQYDPRLASSITLIEIGA